MPFKDKLKQLAYGREYQAKNREKLKELEELHDVEMQVSEVARKYLVGRHLFPVRWLPNSGVQKPLKDEFVSCVPVISANITLPITPLKIEEATLKIVEDEDMLLLTGEHKGWSALGIEGLATIKGRNTVKSCHRFSEDINMASQLLKECGHNPPYTIIAKTKINLSSFPWLSREEPHSPSLISDSYQYKRLCNIRGKQSNMLVVKPSETNFYLLMGQDLTVTRLQQGFKLWEVLAPAICEPKAICEIQGI